MAPVQLSIETTYVSEDYSIKILNGGEAAVVYHKDLVAITTADPDSAKALMAIADKITAMQMALQIDGYEYCEEPPDND